ncbi:MAG: hypothetical protein OJF47_002175 [Nitrospira sp.]|jgi:hypothetical protein|nr:MAG: hypothetical protein OJF47_002175 [Nitrospira sp.]
MNEELNLCGSRWLSGNSIASLTISLAGIGDV